MPVNLFCVPRRHLRENPTGPVAVLAAFVCVVLPAAIFWRSTPSRVWVGDTLPVVPTVVQMLRYGNRDLTRLLPPNPLSERWNVFTPGEVPYFVREVPTRPGIYSGYSAGMELFAWPGVLLADATDADLDSDRVQLNIEQTTAAVVAALSLGLFFLTALHIGSLGAAFATTFLLATGSVYLTTLSQIPWHQTGVAFWVSVVVFVEFVEFVEFRSGGKPSFVGTVIQAIACGQMLNCRPSAVTFLIPFGIWVLARDRRRGVVLPAVAMLSFLPWAWLYVAIYQQPLGPPSSFLSDGENWNFAANVDGVLYSPGRGLFVYQPWLLFLPLLLRRDVRTDADRSTPTGWYAFAAAYAMLHCLLIGSWWGWCGGWCYGPRLVSETIPVLGLLVVRPVGWLLQRYWGWLLLSLVAAVGFAVHSPGVYGRGITWNGNPNNIDKHQYRAWDLEDAPFLYDVRHPVPRER